MFLFSKGKKVSENGSMEFHSFYGWFLLGVLGANMLKANLFFSFPQCSVV